MSIDKIGPKELEYNFIKPKQCFDFNSKENIVDFKVSKLYINNTNEDIYVTLRNNLPIKIPAATGGYNNSKFFTIRTIYKFATIDRITDMINELAEYEKVNGEKNEDISIIKNTLLTAFNNNRHINVVEVIIDREVSINTIKDQNIMYIHETDDLLSFRNIDLKYPHPFSPEGTIIKNYYSLVENKGFTGIFVELIDNDNSIKTRYIYIGKEIVEIPAVRDINKKSGVYYTRANYNNMSGVELVPEFYTFTESETSIGLFKTREEAETGGNPEHLSKGKLISNQKELDEIRHNSSIEQLKKAEKISELETEIAQLKLESIRAKEIYDREKAIRDNELEMAVNKAKLEVTVSNDIYAKEKAARDNIYDEKNKSRADHYESRSYERKDSHEALKIGAAVVITGIGMYVAMSKKK